ncbi:MAG: WD40/YVTN/BNR-like repeat-containing protein [Solirubrobacterales bacterium]
MLAAPAGAAAASKWTVRQLPPQPIRGSSETDQVVLYAVSCPSDSLCVAVGALDTVAFSQAPTGTADRWHVVNPLYDEPKQSCLEEEGVPEESCSYPRGSIDAVSCAGEDLCVAVGYEGNVFASTDPTGGARSWSISDVNEGGSAAHLTGVSCPSPSLCVAVSGGYGAAAGTVLTSSAPASGRWQATQLPGAPDLRAISCATPALCVAVAKEGGIYVSSDPSGGASAWRQVRSPTPRDLQAVSCVASLLCAAGDAGGNLLTSADPTGGAPFAETNPTGSVQITGITCPTTTRCLAVDDNADVLTSTDPTGGPGSWTFENLVPFEADEPDTGQFVKNALFGASCASTSLCALVGANSRIFTSTDPFATPSPSPAAGKRTRRLRPRTHLIFAEGFWRSSVTRHRRIKARFRFYSRDGARAFLCKRDHAPWRRCHSPLRYWVPIGHHTLRVRAIGPTGLRGPIASLRFEVIRPRRS